MARGAGHTIVSFDSVLKGLGKLKLDEGAIRGDLNNHWEVPIGEGGGEGEGKQSLGCRRPRRRGYRAFVAALPDSERQPHRVRHARRAAPRSFYRGACRAQRGPPAALPLEA
jgi:hypothetical protein